MTDYDLALEIKDVLGSATPTPDAVEIYPKGRESKRPEGAKSQWITIVPESRKIIQELNNSYISEVVYKITGVIDSKDSLGTIAQDVINFSESVHALLSSRQLPYARRIPSLVDTDFDEGDLSSVYGFTILATYETQVARGTQHADVLVWTENAGTSITVTITGLLASEYIFKKANGSIGTSGVAYTSSSTGTGRIRVLDSADVTNITNLQLVISG